ncbi:NTP transferase domain-containing protein [Caulobacter sp. RHG1]|uniref:nucleotidyltransferase family protein n=1 Tax=Caulobacter sp. (strain RHG1) TaxID=2545762 RepID=UPI00155355C0|nr:nucleotidyltransferase family protein [Caulobacter sp. RHG1]NQE62156.1 CTP:molybdopterin cytidylyltransferase [Caulobacter sp. RHG1]
MTQSDTGALDAIVLAAGRGARFGGDKLLARLNGRPLIVGALRTALAARVRRVFVAVGEDPALRAAITAESERLILVPVADAAEGMGASLRTTAARVPDDAGGVFVFLGDMPAIAPATVETLAAALAGPEHIVAPSFEGRRGHPVLFGAAWLPALRALSGDEGARAILQTAQRLTLVPVQDPGVLLDVDRPEDLLRL